MSRCWRQDEVAPPKPSLECRQHRRVRVTANGAEVGVEGQAEVIVLSIGDVFDAKLGWTSLVPLLDLRTRGLGELEGQAVAVPAATPL